jgi:hypothetical protein
MEARQARRETTTAIDDTGRIAALTAALRVICIANQLQLSRQSVTVTRPAQRDVQIDFSGREPFGFVFTTGHEAAFHVPSGHRYVIEHVQVSCWAKTEHVDVQLVTRSSHMFRQMSLTAWPKQPSIGETAEAEIPAPILVQGSTANTLLFSDGGTHNSSTVPPETYVQLWGYLEPTCEAEVA